MDLKYFQSYWRMYKCGIQSPVLQVNVFWSPDQKLEFGRTLMRLFFVFFDIAK